MKPMENEGDEFGMPDEETAADRAEAQRLLSQRRMSDVFRPMVDEDRKQFWDRIATPIRSEQNLDELTKDMAWVRRSRVRSDMFGKRIFMGLTGLGTVIGMLAGMIEIYLRFKGVK